MSGLRRCLRNWSAVSSWARLTRWPQGSSIARRCAATVGCICGEPTIKVWPWRDLSEFWILCRWKNVWKFESSNHVVCIYIYIWYTLYIYTYMIYIIYIYIYIDIHISVYYEICMFTMSLLYLNISFRHTSYLQVVCTADHILEIQYWHWIFSMVG